MRRIDIVIGSSIAVFTCSITVQIAARAAGMPFSHDLAYLVSTLSAFAAVVAYTHKLAGIRVQRAAEAMKDVVSQTITEAVAAQAHQLGEAIAEEMREYGNSRAIDAVISNEKRAAARHQAGEETIDLDSVVANALGHHNVAKVTPIRQRR